MVAVLPHRGHFIVQMWVTILFLLLPSIHWRDHDTMLGIFDSRMPGEARLTK